MKKALVLGAGGFIGGHMVNRLKSEGFWVRGVDLKTHEFATSPADEFVLGDLADQRFAAEIFDQTFDEVYQFAADMGGAGYIFTGDHDAEIMHNSASINLNVASNAVKSGAQSLLYSSSACIYPQENQNNPTNPNCTESSAYPANPDSEYGWEKLFSERLYLSYARQYGINARVVRYHNIFGPMGTWRGGREKVPAALCRKVAEAEDGGAIEIWGDGQQTRSFLYIDECLEGTCRVMRSEFAGPVNIGSEEMISINGLAEMVMETAGKSLSLNHIPGPQGVRGRNSDNRLLREKIGWAPSSPLKQGMQKTFAWIEAELQKSQSQNLGTSADSAAAS